MQLSSIVASEMAQVPTLDRNNCISGKTSDSFNKYRCNKFLLHCAFCKTTSSDLGLCIIILTPCDQTLPLHFYDLDWEHEIVCWKISNWIKYACIGFLRILPCSFQPTINHKCEREKTIWLVDKVSFSLFLCLRGFYIHIYSCSENTWCFY